MSTQSVFDPETFLHLEIDSAMETAYTPVDEGEYEAYIEDVEASVVKTQDGDKGVLNVTYALTEESVKASTGMDHPTVRQTLWLDFDDSGSLLFGKQKNVKLGRLREAVGQNVDGRPWSPSQLIGAGPVVIRVTHRYNKETGDGPYANVTRVAAG